MAEFFLAGPWVASSFCQSGEASSGRFVLGVACVAIALRAWIGHNNQSELVNEPATHCRTLG